MSPEDLARAYVAQLLQQPRRAFDIGEEDGHGSLRSPVRPVHPLKDTPCRLGAQHRLPAVNATDRLGDLLGTGALRQKPGRAGAERRQNPLLVREARQRQHTHPRRALSQGLRRCDPIELGHDDVHHDDIRLQRVHLLERLDPVLRLTDDVDVRHEIEEGAEAVPHDRVIVNDQNADLVHQRQPPR